MGESYDHDDVPANGYGVWGYSDEGCDSDRGRDWGRSDLHASPGWSYGHEASDGGCRYGNTDSDAHAYHWNHSDCGTVRPSGHGYDRIHNGGPAADQQMRQEH